MFRRMKPSFVVTVFVAFTFLTVELEATPNLSLGTISKCAHNLGGEVIVVHERQLLIKGFSYDGTAPGPWFHAQYVGAKNISSIEGTFRTLATDKYGCGMLKEHEVHDGTKDVIVYLPEPIQMFQTIGVICYKKCANFGYVKVTDQDYDPGTPDFTEECQISPKLLSPCVKVKHDSVTEKCKDFSSPAGKNDTSGTTRPDAASQLPYLSGSLVISLIILFENHMKY